MADIVTEASTTGPIVQKKDIESRPLDQENGVSVPASGRRAAFRDVRRELTDAELSGPGVLKLLLDNLEEAWAEIEKLRSYVTRFHEADKKAAVLTEKVTAVTAIEILFGVGVGLGGTIIGLTPYFYSVKPEYGQITALVGLTMMIGSAIGRIVKK